MEIDDIKRTSLTPSELDVLKQDTARWERMGSGGHLDDWLAYGPGELIRRRLAMRYANKNRPEGRGYAEALARFRESDGIGHIDKTSIGAVLWLHDDPERLTALRDLRETMSQGDRSRLNSPISARQRVEKIIKARQSGTEEKMKASPVALLNEKIMERDRKIAELEHQLAKQEDGSRFDPKRSSASEIAAIFADPTFMSAHKAKAVADDILARLGQQKQRRKAGAS